jgi:hypothetical protein
VVAGCGKCERCNEIVCPRYATGNVHEMGGMDVAFETERLRRLCEVDAVARRWYGSSTVEQLQARLADIRAALSAAELVVTGAALDPTPPGRILFRLAGGYELVCEGSHPHPRFDNDGLIAFEQLRRVKVVKFGRVRHHA